MTRIAIILAIAALLAGQAAMGQLMMTHVGAGGVTSAGGCSNALDFSQACNSQYIPVVL